MRTKSESEMLKPPLQPQKRFSPVIISEMMMILRGRNAWGISNWHSPKSLLRTIWENFLRTLFFSGSVLWFSDPGQSTNEQIYFYTVDQLQKPNNCGSRFHHNSVRSWSIYVSTMYYDTQQLLVAADTTPPCHSWVRFFGVFRSPSLKSRTRRRISISTRIMNPKDDSSKGHRTNVQRHVMKEIPEFVHTHTTEILARWLENNHH